MAYHSSSSSSSSISRVLVVALVAVAVTHYHSINNTFLVVLLKPPEFGIGQIK